MWALKSSPIHCYQIVNNTICCTLCIFKRNKRNPARICICFSGEKYPHLAYSVIWIWWESTLNIVYFSLFNILNIIHLKLYLYSVQFWILCVIPILTFGRTVIDLSVSSRSSRSAVPVWRTDEFAIPGGFGSIFYIGWIVFCQTLIGLGHLTNQREVRLRQRYVDGDLVPMRSSEELLGNLAEEPSRSRSRSRKRTEKSTRVCVVESWIQLCDRFLRGGVVGDSFDEEPFLGEKNLANVLLASWEPCCELVTCRSWEKKGIVGGKLVVSRLIGRWMI